MTLAPTRRWKDWIHQRLAWPISPASHYRFHFSCLDHATGIYNTLYIFLDGLEAHVPTTLTLQMINHGSESREFFSTMTARAMVELLLVYGGVEVLVQGPGFAEGTMAKIALIGPNIVIPCLVSSLVADGDRPSE